MSDSENEQIENQDEPMIEEENSVDNEEIVDAKEEEEVDIQPLTIDNIEDDNKNATFTFYDEEHTLGNVLRNTLIKNKNVDFCGYTVPHPSEPYMKLRVQSNKKDAKVVLKHGFKRISKECDIITEKFLESVAKFKQTQMED
ncbi:unnamed protein product [Moneuplotes crassus]|uniref:DNA-directed RNA polymerase RBP11-like dimerisation domain-containing protein n=1 Tax=Euplotes crassus TaxID=5936 RepID=A0AAD1Y1N3_EUPCR|nr:unnamed protein product [Moneuplotes crassus]